MFANSLQSGHTGTIASWLKRMGVNILGQPHPLSAPARMPPQLPIYQFLALR